MYMYGINALMQIWAHLIFIFLAFRGLQSLNLETFFKREYQNTPLIRLTLLLISIALGYTVSSFFMEFIQLCRNLFQSF
ncbi:MAG: DUF1146 family protein [Streptococcaceae bacterium]|nr:DUF1146 family protein [Streptococcaceae bacterium]